MRYLYLFVVLVSGIIPGKGAFLEQLQKRDSILIADQLSYGFELDDIKEGTVVQLPDLSEVLNDTLVLVDNWKLDTLNQKRKTPFVKLRGHIVISPFEEGEYTLPPLSVLLTPPGGDTDTLVFEALKMEVKTMPVDTATFEINDIKGQIRYPVTFREVLPYIIGVILLAGLVTALVILIRRRRQTEAEKAGKDPAYIVALRKLEQFRGEKYWAEDKQKAFYSGITDTLREYMADRFGIDAKEMTTAEIFSELRNSPEITPDLYAEAKDLFELADFVKFAKHTASNDDNAGAIPVAVRFVMGTYKEEEEPEGDVVEDGPEEK